MSGTRKVRGILHCKVYKTDPAIVDVTAVSDYMPATVGRTIALPNAGGDAMTERLFELLGPKGWNVEMCEQLKKSHICEVLGVGVPLPGSGVTQQLPSNPAAAASTGATSSGPDAPITEAPRGPGVDTEVGDDDDNGADKTIEDDGVLDVASIGEILTPSYKLYS